MRFVREGKGRLWVVDFLKFDPQSEPDESDQFSMIMSIWVAVDDEEAMKRRPQICP